MKPVYIISIVLASIAVIVGLIGYLLGYKSTFFVVFYFTYISIIIIGVISWNLYFSKFVGVKKNDEVTHDMLSEEIQQYIMNEQCIQIGKTFSKGCRKVGMEGETKVSVYFWHFRDCDSSEEFCVAINMTDLNVRQWIKIRKSDDKRKVRQQVNDLINDLGESKSQSVIIQKEVTDPLSGRTTTETTKQPFYLQKEQVKEKEGEL